MNLIGIEKQIQHTFRGIDMNSFTEVEKRKVFKAVVNDINITTC